MIKGITTIYNVVAFLNSLLEYDREALQALCFKCVMCNEKLGEHPTVQTDLNVGMYSVGLVGVLNGLFGVDSEGWGAIAATVDDEGKLVGFTILEDRLQDVRP